MLEQNKHIARQFIAAFAAADTRTLDRIVAEHMVSVGCSSRCDARYPRMDFNGSDWP